MYLFCFDTVLGILRHSAPALDDNGEQGKLFIRFCFDSAKLRYKNKSASVFHTGGD